MLYLVLGGASNGKSEFAERLVLRSSHLPRYYLACMQVSDAEDEARVARHRALRQDKGFQTLEQYTDIGKVDILPNSCVLVECLSNLLANEMFSSAGVQESCVENILAGLLVLEEKSACLVVVSNDIFSTGEQYDPLCEQYLDQLAQLNRRLAEEAEAVVEVVVGLPIFHKAPQGGLPL